VATETAAGLSEALRSNQEESVRSTKIRFATGLVVVESDVAGARIYRTKMLDVTILFDAPPNFSGSQSSIRRTTTP
jgi:hypothetical protein